MNAYRQFPLIETILAVAGQMPADIHIVELKHQHRH